MLVTSHRGAGFLEPENTLRAIRRAIALGVDQIEVDAQLTRDDHVILMHDPTVDRTTNGSGKVAEMTLEDIRCLDAGFGEHVPLLAEALELVGSTVVLQVELKGPGTAVPVVRLIEAAGRQDDVILTSFMHNLLREAQQVNPRLQTGALWGKVPGNAIQLAHQLGVQALHLWHESINEELVADAHANGLLVRAWNANQVEEMRRLVTLGVDAIGSDRPDLLLEVCRESGVR